MEWALCSWLNREAIKGKRHKKYTFTRRNFDAWVAQMHYMSAMAVMLLDGFQNFLFTYLYVHIMEDHKGPGK